MPAAKKADKPLKIRDQAHYDSLIEFDPPSRLENLVVERPNVHPADELAMAREVVKRYQAIVDKLRDQLLEDGADLTGDEYRAVLVPSVRETLDRKAITEAYGEKAIAPFIKTTKFATVKLEKK